MSNRWVSATASRICSKAFYSGKTSSSPAVVKANRRPFKVNSLIPTSHCN